MATIAPRSRRSERADALSGAFRSRYHDYQYRFVEFFVEHLSDLSRAFGGDLHQMLILAVLGQVHIGRARDRTPSATPAGMTSSRLSDVTGIPRETVRRKLADLRERGWVVRTADGMWQIAVESGRASARNDLGEIDLRSLARVARLVADLEDLA